MWLLHETMREKKKTPDRESDKQVCADKGGEWRKSHAPPTAVMKWRRVVVISFSYMYIYHHLLFAALIRGLLFCAPTSFASCLCMELMAHFPVTMNRGEL